MVKWQDRKEPKAESTWAGSCALALLPGTAVVGFTLLELMIVISIIIILVSVALPQYQKTIMHTRETILSYDLDTMRKLIDQYAADKGKLPQSLDDLVTAGYMRESRRIQLLITRTGTLSPATIRTRLKAVPESSMCIVPRAKSQLLELRTANGEYLMRLSIFDGDVRAVC